MLGPQSTRKLEWIGAKKTIFLLVFLFCVPILVGPHLSYSLQRSDFPNLYCAARMLAEGLGHQLYNAELQRQCQERYIGGMSTFYIHPPFEALLYLAVAWLPLRRAYVLWSLFSLAFLFCGLRHLAKESLPWDWRLVVGASLAFVPVLLCLMQGQDATLFLLLVILAFSAFRRGRFLAAGCWLGLGLFKFQLVLPMALILIWTHKKEGFEFARGFGLVAFALAGISAAISGWPVFTVYPKFLMHLLRQTSSGVSVQAMANLHGLIYLFFHRTQSGWKTGAVLILSCVLLLRTLSMWKQSQRAYPRSASSTYEFDFAFAQTVMFALLASFYLNPHDLSLLLLPIALLLRHISMLLSRPGFAKWLVAGLLTILYLPPMHLWVLDMRVYGLMGIPLLALFFISPWLTPRVTSPGKATTIQG